MKAYILAIAGAVLLSATLAVIAPTGRMGKFVKGMTKLVLLSLLISPFFSLAQGKGFVFESAKLGEDAAYMEESALIMDREDARVVQQILGEKFGVIAEAAFERAEDFSLKKICVKITDPGIYGGDEHIDMLAEAKRAIEERFGCKVEVAL